MSKVVLFAPPTCHHIPPREGMLPTSVALTALPTEVCHQLDCREATVPVIGWLFETAAKSDQHLLTELYRYHQALRPISLLDVLALLLIAGPAGERVSQRARVLLVGSGEEN